MNRRDVLAGGVAMLSAAMPAPRTLAYPDRAIRLVVPFSPGGATDVVGRLWAEKMKPFLGTVVTENRGGGGGVTGAAEVARAQPDGHTFLFGNTSTQVLIPAIVPNPPYDPLKDFVGIYILCNAPTSIVVHASVPARNLAELIAYARANPGKLSYGSAGAGTVTNLAGELFKQLTGAPDIVHIPYKGAAPGVADLASGHIPMMTPNVGGPLLEFHRAGKVRILAVNAASRIKAAPDIPTSIEGGSPASSTGCLRLPASPSRLSSGSPRPRGRSWRTRMFSASSWRPASSRSSTRGPRRHGNSSERSLRAGLRSSRRPALRWNNVAAAGKNRVTQQWHGARDFGPS